MILGVGVDVVDVARFALALDRTPGLRQRLFTPAERGLAISSLAARFAAKEAAAKVLGGPPGLRWHDAWVANEPSGRPRLEVTGTVAAAAASAGVRVWHLSLAHDGGLATACVLAES